MEKESRSSETDFKFDPQSYLENLKTHLESELKQVDSHAQWYKKRARHSKIKYLVVRVPIIVLGILLPQIAAIQIVVQNTATLAITTFIIASLIAILTGLDTFFRYGESWTEEKNAELALYALQRKYKREKLRVEHSESYAEAIDTAEGVIDGLRTDYEQIVGGTVGAFVKRAKESATSQASSKSLSAS